MSWMIHVLLLKCKIKHMSKLNLNASKNIEINKNVFRTGL